MKQEVHLKPIKDLKLNLISFFVDKRPLKILFESAIRKIQEFETVCFGGRFLQSESARKKSTYCLICYLYCALERFGSNFTILDLLPRLHPHLLPHPHLRTKMTVR